MISIRTGFFLIAAASCLAGQDAPKVQQQPTIVVAPPPPSDAPPAVPPDKVVLTVGDHKITAAEFSQIVESLPEQYRAAVRGSARAQFGENVARVFALADEGRRQKLDATASYRTVLQFQSDNLLASLALERINQTTKPSEAEVRKYFDEHQAEFKQVSARHILVRAKGAPTPIQPGKTELTDAEALAKAQALRARIQGGEDFAKVASAESDDPGSGSNGGQLPRFGRGQMVPDFEEAAFKLQPGELSQPVKTQFGYHLIQTQAIETAPFEEARTRIEQQLGPQRAQTALDELVKKASPVLDPEYFPKQQEKK